MVEVEPTTPGSLSIRTATRTVASRNETADSGDNSSSPRTDVAFSGVPLKCFLSLTVM